MTRTTAHRLKLALHLALYLPLVLLFYLGLGLGLALNPLAGTAIWLLVIILAVFNTRGLLRTLKPLPKPPPRQQ